MSARSRSREITLDGGPHDGTTLRTGLGAAFLFTDGRRCFRAPGARRVLYRAMGDQAMTLVSRYKFVDHLMCLCSCGAFRKRSRPCRLCGESLPKTELDSA